MIVLCGKSGSGKNTILSELEGMGYIKIVTYTTRPRRPGENENDYHFISQAEFESILANGGFLETTKYDVSNGDTWYYGTPIYEGFENRNKVVILNPDGVRKLKDHEEYFPVIIYLYTDDRIRLKRLYSRGDDVMEIHRRYITDQEDFADIEKLADFVVPNNVSDPRTVAEYIDLIYEEKKHEAI